MSPCWVEFRQPEVPNTWNPVLVGTRFKPKRRPRYFGSVPTIRCVSSKRGLKCFRQNSINKRWYSLSPVRTCARMFPRRGPASARAVLELRGQRAQLNPHRFMNAENMVPGIKIPSEYETHVLNHMRCNCSACMNFACQWRRALKDEIRQSYKNPLTPKRKPKRWMPVLERHRPSERVRFLGRPDKQTHCRRSPRVSWWCGNYSPLSDSDENVLKPEGFDVEQRQKEKLKHLRHSQQHAAESNADRFEDVAMDGTKLPSRLTYRGTRDNTVGCSSKAATSSGRPQSTRRHRLAQGILNSEDVPAGFQIDELEDKSKHRLSPTKKYTNLPSENWGTDNIYESQDENQRLVNDLGEILKLSETENSQSFRNVFSDKSANKLKSYRDNLRSSRNTYQGAVGDDKANNYYDATRRNQYRRQYSERSDKGYGRGHHHLHHSEESCSGLSYPDSHVTKYARNNAGRTRDHYQQYSKTHPGRYLLHVDPMFEANPTCHGSLSRSLSYLDDSLDSCHNRRHRHYCRQHRSLIGQQYLHQHRHCPLHQHHSSSHFHDDIVWNYSHHASQSPVETSRQVPRNCRNYPSYTEIDQEIHSNKNIYNRSVVGGTRDTHTTRGGNMRGQINFHTTKSEKSKQPGSDDSNESSVKSRSPSKLCKRWTSLSPSKFDLRPSKKKPISAREFNDNENKSITESPSSVDSERERLRNPEKRDDRKRCSENSSRRKQKFLNAERSPLPAGSSPESENNIYKRQRTFSLSPLDSARLKTPGRRRRSRSRSRKTEDSKTKLTENERRVLNTTQSNSSYSPGSPTKHRADTKALTLGPSERVMREPRPKSRPEWLNKHVSLMTECSQEQQNNAKSRMTRIVDKTNALSRSTEHVKLDFSQLHERLDRVKDLQQSYFERAEEAIQRMKDRNNASYRSHLAEDNSQNERENHRRVPTSALRDASPDQMTRRRRTEDANRHGTRAKQTKSSVERGRLYGKLEDGNVERHCRDRIVRSEAGSDIGVGDTLPTTDSGSEPDNDDGGGSWFIDDKRRLIARRNASTMKHKSETNW